MLDVVKMLKGPFWEERFLDFIKLFTERRSAFQFEINFLTLVGVGVVSEKVSGLDNKLSDKLDRMKTMLQELMSPEEKELSMLIKCEGGIAAFQEDDKLKKLSDLEQVREHPMDDGLWKEAGDKSSDFEKLKDDLSIDPKKAMDDNMKVFSGKFEVKKRLVEELSLALKNALNSGPHEKINNDVSASIAIRQTYSFGRSQDLRELWRIMVRITQQITLYPELSELQSWRGSVKSRRFVMALRDYFHESWRSHEDPKTDEGSKASSDPKENAAPPVVNRSYEPWALAYIHVTLLQPISEAFDDDGTGFITVAEVNAFTALLPRQWK